jgi:hypothetical protein
LLLARAALAAIDLALLGDGLEAADIAALNAERGRVSTLVADPERGQGGSQMDPRFPPEASDSVGALVASLGLRRRWSTASEIARRLARPAGGDRTRAQQETVIGEGASNAEIIRLLDTLVP